MSVTLTGGITFSGITFANGSVPAPENTAAWFGGGYSSTIVDRITFATDTATASVRGPLSLARHYLAAAGNETDGWFGGGSISGNVPVSNVQRITYATDTATASVRGPLSQARYRLAAAGNSDYGWFGGGTLSQPSAVSTVDRITYATDTATASVRGPLSSARYGMAAAGNSDYGWRGGGGIYSGVLVSYSTVDRITYATDTATASVRGPLSLARQQLAAAGNTTDGWFG